MKHPLILVEHHTGDPVEDCVVAAEIHAIGQGCSDVPIAFQRLVSPQRVLDPNSRQHVAPSGVLMGNEWLWLERLGCLSAAPELEVSAEEVRIDIGGVVSCNGRASPGLDVGGLLARCSTADAVLHVEVTSREDGLVAYLLDHRKRPQDKALASWRFDGWSRPRLQSMDVVQLRMPVGSISRSARGGEAPSSSPPAGPIILVVGEEQRLRRQYPALLAALGDAADASGLAPEVSIVSPRGIAGAEAEEITRSVDGILLPGGCDNSQVDGQIEIVRAALRRRTAVLGSCFGMQTMVTAFARERLGVEQAHLEEIDPQGRPLTFKKMLNADDSIWHRLGPRGFAVLPGTLARSIYRSGFGRERMNHRHCLASDIREPLENAGLVVSGRSEANAMADVIELPGHPFFLGIQGHPELSSRAGRPHPAFAAFLTAASTGTLS